MDYEAARTGLLHHVELWVLDLSAARPRWQWLLDSLGYEQFQSWDNGVSYRLGPTYIVLEQSPALIEGSHERRRPGADGPTLNFEYEAGYVAPVWPSVAGQQQLQTHLDIAVDDPAEAEAWAVQAGATLAEFQPQDDVRVMLDPLGDPFCLFLAG